MSLEYGFPPESANFKADAAPVSKQSASESTESRTFGHNDIILPDDEVADAQMRLQEMGVRAESNMLSAREVLNPQGTAWKPGEFLLTLTEVADGEPLGEARFAQVVGALRSGPDQMTIRFAKLRQGQ